MVSLSLFPFSAKKECKVHKRRLIANCYVFFSADDIVDHCLVSRVMQMVLQRSVSVG